MYFCACKHDLTLVPLLQIRADESLGTQNWQRCVTHEGNIEGVYGLSATGIPCPNLQHSLYDVLPIDRNGHCLFLCFVDILRNRNVPDAPQTQKSMRKAIADFFDQQPHRGKIQYEEGLYPCDENIRTNGYGGTTEIMAFASLYKLSVQIHSPETNATPQFVSFGPSNAACEMLLQTLGWHGSNRAPSADHWQRLKYSHSQSSSESPPRPDRKYDKYYSIMSKMGGYAPYHIENFDELGRGLVADEVIRKGDPCGLYEGLRVDRFGRVLFCPPFLSELFARFPQIDRQRTGAAFQQSHTARLRVHQGNMQQMMLCRYVLIVTCNACFRLSVD